ncbi:peroxiredoxin [soil metagenome]
MKRLAVTAAALSAAALASSAHAALPIGAAAPTFTGKGGLAGKEIDFNLATALKKGPVVLYFFPAAFTSGCTKEAHDFAEATADFAKLNATVVGVTAGNADRVVEFSKVECRDKFAVIADPGGAISKTYDAKMPVVAYSARTSYVIAKDGKIALAYNDMNPDQHVAKTLAAVKGLSAK